MNSSKFYEIALDMINRETKRLDALCAYLDDHPSEKKERMVEYKRTKYRYAGATNVWCMFFHSHRVAAKHADAHYLIPQVNEIFVRNSTYLSFYEAAPEEEKADYGLYYGVIAFAEQEIAKLEEKIPSANDWEKIELEERIGGLTFAKNCLDEAWKRRKDVLA